MDEAKSDNYWRCKICSHYDPNKACKVCEPKRGRPKLSEDCRKSVAYKFRMTETERLELIDLAKALGISTSQLIRDALTLYKKSLYR